MEYIQSVHKRSLSGGIWLLFFLFSLQNLDILLFGANSKKAQLTCLAFDWETQEGYPCIHKSVFKCN